MPVVAVEHDVVAVAVRRPEAVDAAGAQQLAADDAVEQRLRRARTGRARRRRAAGDRGLPGSGLSAPTRRRRTSSRCTARARRDRRRPARPGERGTAWARNSKRRPIASCVGIGERRPVAPRAVLLAQRRLFDAIRLVEPGRCSSLIRLDTTSTTREASGTCTTGRSIFRRNLHGRVLPARRRAADEQRQVEAALLHLLGDVRPSRRATA